MSCIVNCTNGCSCFSAAWTSDSDRLPCVMLRVGRSCRLSQIAISIHRSLGSHLLSSVLNTIETTQLIGSYQVPKKLATSRNHVLIRYDYTKPYQTLLTHPRCQSEHTSGFPPQVYATGAQKERRRWWEPCCTVDFHPETMKFQFL